jgi:hypothetical protein
MLSGGDSTIPPAAISPVSFIHSASKSIPILGSASAQLEIPEPAQQLVIRNATQLKADTGHFDGTVVLPPPPGISSNIPVNPTWDGTAS